jgi:hypothetical protein
VNPVQLHLFLLGALPSIIFAPVFAEWQHQSIDASCAGRGPFMLAESDIKR